MHSEGWRRLIAQAFVRGDTASVNDVPIEIEVMVALPSPTSAPACNEHRHRGGLHLETSSGQPRSTSEHLTAVPRLFGILEQSKWAEAFAPARLARAERGLTTRRVRRPVSSGPQTPLRPGQPGGGEEAGARAHFVC